MSSSKPGKVAVKYKKQIKRRVLDTLEDLAHIPKTHPIRRQLFRLKAIAARAHVGCVRSASMRTQSKRWYQGMRARRLYNRIWQRYAPPMTFQETVSGPDKRVLHVICGAMLPQSGFNALHPRWSMMLTQDYVSTYAGK